jgi:hypothetical protein
MDLGKEKPDLSCIPRNVSAESYVSQVVLNVLTKLQLVYDAKTKKTIFKKSSLAKIQVAGLNLMATFLASYNLIHELGINPSKVYVKVPEICLRLPGYDCQLKLNDVLPLYDLFYGSILAS